MIKVVDSHHKVLIHWAEFRKSLGQSPRLITLDHHTDTSAPFRKAILEREKVRISDSSFLKIQSSYLKKINYQDLESVKDAIKILNNDEHIVAAIKVGIIDSAFVLAHLAADTDEKVFKEHKIVCRGIAEVHEKSSKLKYEYDTVIESEVLKNAVKGFNEVLNSISKSEDLLSSKPYILDIDLDYFNTFKSVEPKDSSFFKEMIAGAGLITVATEPEYVKRCAVDENLTAELLLKVLRNNFFS